MDLEDKDIKENFNESVLKNYLSKIFETQPIEEILFDISYRIQMFDDYGDSDIINVIDGKYIDYIILITKLSTMIEMFKVMKNENNLVMSDILKNEIEKFIDIISESISKTNKELKDEE